VGPSRSLRSEARQLNEQNKPHQLLTMKWITREKVKVDRVACRAALNKFVDEDAEFVFVPANEVMEESLRLDATLFDLAGVDLGHHGKECSFKAIAKKYDLSENVAVRLLGKIVYGIDTDNTVWDQPEGCGVKAIVEGFRHLGASRMTTRSTSPSGLSMMRSTPIARKCALRRSRRGC
jgi:hypothetical protein